MANLIFDDSRSDKFTIGGGTWSAVTAARFFGGGSIWPAFASTTDKGDTGSYGSLNVSFEGTQIRFFGNTPSLPASQNIFVSIDGGTSYDTSYGDTAPPTAVQWYQSPVLPDGKHTISITHIAGTSLDYMVVAAGQNTPLTGQALIVDDDDPAISYNGNWARHEGRFTLQDDPHESMPHGNATHQSNSQGSTATFLFSGTNVAVYSVFDYSHIGSVTVTYTIDNSISQTKTHSVTPATTEFQAGVLSRGNVLLFSSDVAAGDHKLTMQVAASVNQMPLVLDYILYTPSFATLAAKPNLSPSSLSSSTSGLPSSSTSSSSTPSGGGLKSSSTGTGTGVAAGSTSGANPGPSTSPGSGSSTSSPVGAIVGGVVGGVAVLAVLLLLVLCRKRISKRVSSSASSQSPVRADLLSVEPFTSTAPNTAVTYGDDSRHKPRSSAFSAFPGTATTMHHGSSRTGTGSDVASTGVPDVQRPEMSQYKSSLSNTPVRREYAQQEQDAESLSRLGLGSDSIVLGGAPAAGSGSGGVFRTRMQRLQALVTELNQEIERGGEEGVRAAELKGRIAELTRETEDSQAEDRERERRLRESMATTMVPPPYEPRRD